MDILDYGVELIVAGLVLDIVGVYFLSRSLILSKEAIGLLSGTYWDENLHLKTMLQQQSRDANVGLGTIVVGFGLQIVGTLII